MRNITQRTDVIKIYTILQNIIQICEEPPIKLAIFIIIQ